MCFQIRKTISGHKVYFTLSGHEPFFRIQYFIVIAGNTVFINIIGLSFYTESKKFAAFLTEEIIHPSHGSLRIGTGIAQGKTACLRTCHGIRPVLLTGRPNQRLITHIVFFTVQEYIRIRHIHSAEFFAGEIASPCRSVIFVIILPKELLLIQFIQPYKVILEFIIA